MTSLDDESRNDPRQAIVKDGIYFVGDTSVGKTVDAMATEKFPFKTKAGLGFCKRHTFEDERIRSILETFFPWSGLGFYKAFGREPDRIFSFLNRAKPDIPALIVALWSSRSRAIFYRGSHLVSLDAQPAANGLLEISSSRLHDMDIEPIEREMKDGGLTILDGRIGFKIIEGFAILFGFASKEELRAWAKMTLPESAILRKEVAEMETERIGTNFDFVG